jgi:hypothetical protein
VSGSVSLPYEHADFRLSAPDRTPDRDHRPEGGPALGQWEVAATRLAASPLADSTSGGEAAAERSAAGQPRQVGVIELSGSSGGVSTAWRLQHRDHSVVKHPGWGPAKCKQPPMWPTSSSVSGDGRSKCQGTAGSSWSGSLETQALVACGRSSWRSGITARNCPGSALMTVYGQLHLGEVSSRQQELLHAD